MDFVLTFVDPPNHSRPVPGVLSHLLKLIPKSLVLGIDLPNTLSCRNTSTLLPQLNQQHKTKQINFVVVVL